MFAKFFLKQVLWGQFYFIDAFYNWVREVFFFFLEINFVEVYFTYNRTYLFAVYSLLNFCKYICLCSNQSSQDIEKFHDSTVFPYDFSRVHSYCKMPKMGLSSACIGKWKKTSVGGLVKTDVKRGQRSRWSLFLHEIKFDLILFPM